MAPAHAGRGQRHGGGGRAGARRLARASAKARQLRFRAAASVHPQAAIIFKFSALPTSIAASCTNCYVMRKHTRHTLDEPANSLPSGFVSR